MTVHKLSFDINGRQVSMIVKEGVLATMEVGALINNKETPEHRACVIVGRNNNVPAAWVQVSKAQSGAFVVVTEGWIGPGAGTTLAFAAAPIGKIEQATAAEAKQQENANFGILACCTANGSGCYVRCCGGCCSDPTRCPGASCCP